MKKRSGENEKQHTGQQNQGTCYSQPFPAEDIGEHTRGYRQQAGHEIKGGIDDTDPRCADAETACVKGHHWQPHGHSEIAAECDQTADGQEHVKRSVVGPAVVLTH
jgi:hypothetical protein